MPLKWSRPRIFYGWYVVGACFFIGLYVSGAVFQGFTAMFESIVTEFDWSYTQLSIAASLRGLEVGLFAPITGKLADRYGPRKLILSGAIFSAIGLVLAGQSTSLTMFYVASGFIAIGMSASVLTVLMTAISNWFHKRVGLATGIVSSGFGFSGLMIPLVGRLNDTYGWRPTMKILALGMLVLLIPLGLVLRHKPEQYGYLPDGEVKVPETIDIGSASSQVTKGDISVKQALKSSAFWHVALAFTLHLAIMSAVVTHIIPYLSSFGIIRSTALLVGMTLPLMGIVGRFGLGWLGDKVDKRKVSAGAFAIIGFGLIFFGYAPNTSSWLLIPFLILSGIGLGGTAVQRPSLVRELFGRSNFGTIIGLVVATNMLGSMIGPALAGWAFDSWGSYSGIWFGFASLALIAMISVITTPLVRNKE